MKLEIWASEGERHEIKRQRSKALTQTNQKTDGPQEETGIIWRVLVYLLGLLTRHRQLLLFIEPTRLCPANKKGRTIYSLEGKSAPFQSTNKMSGYHSIIADCCLSSRSEENAAWIKDSQQRNQSFLWHEAMIVENECVYVGMYVEPPGEDGCDGCEFISLGCVLRS